MSKTKFVRMAVATLCFASAATGGHTQTLAQLADAQRAKLQQDIQSASNPARSSAARNPCAAKPVRVEPVIVVHSVYSRDMHFVAELTDGNQLVIAVPGMRFKGQQIDKIDVRGVHLKAVDGCKRACDKNRVVAVGGKL